MTEAELLKELARVLLAPIEEAEGVLLENPSFVVMSFASAEIKGNENLFSCAHLISDDVLEGDDEKELMQTAPTQAVAAMYLQRHSEGAMKNALETAQAIKNHIASGEEENG